MGTTTEELKKLYAKLGGTDPNIPKASTPGEVLNGINELDLGGDKLPEVTEADNGKALGVKQGQWDKMDVDIELPDVTTDDNGKVLMVSDGNWGKSDLPKVGDIVFDCTGNSLDGNWTLINNKKISDIFTALNNNVQTNVYLRGYISNNGTTSYTYLKCTAYATNSGTPRAMFVGICRWNFGSADYNRDTVVIESYFDNSSPNNKVIPMVHNYMLPPVRSDDNGKILSVVNGAWTKAAASGNVVIIEATKSGNYANLPSGVTIQNIRDLVYIDKKVVIIMIVSQYEVKPYIISTGTPSSYVYGFSISDNDTIINATFIKSDGDTSFHLYSKVLYTTSNGYLLPNVSSSDNNKIMQVVNGSWSKVNLPTELPAVTASDNGKILKVVDGVWTAVDPNA